MMRRTVSILVEIPREQALKTMSLCSEIFNIHSEWGRENGTYNKNKAHHALYFRLREQFPEVPAAMIQAVRDTAMESLRACRLKRTPRKKPKSAVRLDRRTFSLRGNLLSLALAGGRFRTMVEFPKIRRDMLDDPGWKMKGATLVYEQGKRRFQVKFCFETDDPQKVDGKVLGIDRGIRHLAVTSDGRFFSGSQIRGSQRRYLHNRMTLQAKGTKSAKRRLVRMTGREKRFSKDVNHGVAKGLAETPGVGTFVLEDLSGIRQRRRGRRLNKRISSWPFWQLEMFLGYKATALGKSVETVDARYTSQGCSRCGCVSKNNRSKSRFLCVRCGMHMHADLNAAVNIRDRWILSRTSLEDSGAGCSQSAACGTGRRPASRKPTALAVGS